jgi:LysR family transcriptional regulator, glycine cleavage system transcriptional activator
VFGSISLKGIRAFEAVARLGSFKAAAEELKLTSSAVSHAVIDLERDLGIGLIDRQRRGGKLTERGEAFYTHVRLAFDQLRLGIDETSLRMRKVFRLHAAPSFAAGWLSPRLPKLLALHPDIEVRLSAGTDYSNFASNDFDADIVYGPVRATNVTMVPIAEETVAPMCAPAIAASITSPADLRRHVLIQSDTKMVRWSHWFEKNGLSDLALHGIRFDRSFLAIAAAADGLGVALESTLLAERDLASGRLVMPLAGVAQDITYVGHSFVFPKLAKPNKLVAVFSGWLKAEIDARTVATSTEATPNDRRKAKRASAPE